MTTASLVHDSSPSTAEPGRALHIALWVAQGLLAAAFLAAGGTKLTTPLPQLGEMMPVFTGSIAPLARFVGTVEVLGAVGLVLPAATRIKPNLTVWAALGLAAVMVLAFGTHIMRGEFGALGVNVVLGGLAAFVAWGRGRKRPISTR